MSDQMVWALKDAPTADPFEHSVLGVMSQAGDEDGANCYLSVPTIAERAKCSEHEVRACIKALLARGLIGYGDQDQTSHIRGDHRPINYDLLIPYAYYSPQVLDRINRFRAGRGRPPLSPDTCEGHACADRAKTARGPRCGHRPPIAPPPPRKRRSDLGTKRSKPNGVTSSNPAEIDGVTTSTPVHGVTDSPGGLIVHDGVTSKPIDENTSSQVNGHVPRPRGDYQSPNLSNQSHDLSSSRPVDDPPATDQVEPGTGGGGEARSQTEPGTDIGPGYRVLTQVQDDTQVPPARRLRGKQMAELAAAVTAHLDRGWTHSSATQALSSPLGDVGNVYATLRWRVANLLDGPPPQLAPPPVIRRPACPDCHNSRRIIVDVDGREVATICPACAPVAAA